MDEYQKAMDVAMLRKSVVLVYDQIDAMPTEKAGAEHWTLYNHEKAKQMVSWVRGNYLTLTGTKCAIESWMIAETYIRFRKMKSKNEWRHEPPSLLDRIG